MLKTRLKTLACSKELYSLQIPSTFTRGVQTARCNQRTCDLIHKEKLKIQSYRKKIRPGLAETRNLNIRCWKKWKLMHKLVSFNISNRIEDVEFSGLGGTNFFLLIIFLYTHYLYCEKKFLTKGAQSDWEEGSLFVVGSPEKTREEWNCS